MEFLFLNAMKLSNNNSITMKLLIYCCNNTLSPQIIDALLEVFKEQDTVIGRDNSVPTNCKEI